MPERVPRSAVARHLALGLLPLLLHPLARELDRALGLLLRAGVEPAGLLRELLRAADADGASGLGRAAACVGAGLLAWAGLAAERARREGRPFNEALRAETATLTPLLLRPAITLLALASVAVRPSYPYAFTLPVALTQDWGLGQDLAALATIVALRAPLPRLPAPRGRELLLIGFLGYALLTPAWARVWQGHPGNEPKYLRQAVALGHELSFDAEGVSAAMEDLPVRSPGQALVRAASTLVRESGRMLAAVVRGEAGRDAIRAQRITRQTIRGKDGGVYYVLAPGPSLLLAPTLRLDRALNLKQGTRDRLAVSVLAWNAFAALLVVAVFQLVRDATGRPGLAAALAFLFGLLPPFLLFSFQFYPELLGALVLAVAFRALAVRPREAPLRPWRFGWLLATLPWLHQKFIPVWLVLTATALVVAGRAVREPAARSERAAGASAAIERGNVSGRFPAWKGPAAAVLAGILLPQIASAYLTALYNFAITGSARPDALFLAWGPGGVTGARVGQGLLGLLLDARYGLLPYAPLLMVAAAGFWRGGVRAFALVLPSALAYYLTVASADNWAGAVCNLGRYVMPLVPLGVALVGIALAGPPARPAAVTQAEASGAIPRPTLGRGGVALALMLTAWSLLFAAWLWRDPIAANDSALLIAKSSYADGTRYIPGLFLRHWHDAAPGLWARVSAWVVALGLVGVSLARPRSAVRALAGVAVTTLGLGCWLESWPGGRSEPRFANALEAGAGERVFLEGAAEVRPDVAVLGPGTVTLVRRSLGAAGTAAGGLRAAIGGTGFLKARGLPAVALRPTGAVVELPFLPYHVVAGADGRVAAFSRSRLEVSGQAVVRFEGEAVGAAAPAAATAPAADREDAEPDEGRLR